MSKNKTKTQDEFESELRGEPPVYDGMGLAILPKAGGGFNLVKITLDSKNLKAGEVEVIDTADSKGEATEKFKIAVVRNGII